MFPRPGGPLNADSALILERLHALVFLRFRKVRGSTAFVGAVISA
jgi:hypothetical protein